MNSCVRTTVEHKGLCVYEGDGDAHHHGVDEARESVIREGEATDLVASGITNASLEALARASNASMANGWRHTVQCACRTPM